LSCRAAGAGEVARAVVVLWGEGDEVAVDAVDEGHPLGVQEHVNHERVIVGVVQLGVEPVVQSAQEPCAEECQVRSVLRPGFCRPEHRLLRTTRSPWPVGGCPFSPGGIFRPGVAPTVGARRRAPATDNLFKRYRRTRSKGSLYSVQGVVEAGLTCSI